MIPHEGGEGMRMRKIFGLAIVAILAGCSQGGEEKAIAEGGVCPTLNTQLADVQKETSYQMDRLLGRARAREAAPDPEDRSLYLERLAMESREMARLNAVLTLMAGHGCDLPTAPPDPYEYIEAASDCGDAERSESADMQRLCARENWESNSAYREREEGVREAMRNSPLGQDSPPREEGN